MTMKFEVSDVIKERLLGRIPGIVQIGNELFIKYDKITFNSISGTVEFYCGRELMCTMRNDRYEPGTILTLTGIEGHTPLSMWHA